MDGRARVAKNLRRIRIEQAVSQEHLAVDAGIDRTYVGGIEREEFNPTVDILDRLAAALKIGVAGLLALPDPAHQVPLPLKRGRKQTA